MWKREAEQSASEGCKEKKNSRGHCWLSRRKKAMNQGMQVTLEAGKVKKMDSPLEIPVKTPAGLTPDFSPMRLISNLCSPEL